MAKLAINFKHKPFNPAYTHIRLDDVCKKVFLKSSSIYQKMAKGKFPASVQLSPRVVVWREADIDQWLIDAAINQGSGVEVDHE